MQRLPQFSCVRVWLYSYFSNIIRVLLIQTSFSLLFSMSLHAATLPIIDDSRPQIRIALDYSSHARAGLKLIVATACNMVLLEKGLYFYLHRYIGL